MSRNEKIMSRVREHYDELISMGYEVVGIFLQGSQNYDLDIYDDEYTSDIDTKAIVLPSFDDIVFGRSPKSTTHVRKNNEHIDIKDIRVWVDMWAKQNISYLEILFTDFCIINEKYKDILDNSLYPYIDNISRISETLCVKCMLGMCYEKEKALEHPYPATLDKIAKFGYDPKQLHHIIRLEDVCRRYTAGESLMTAYKPSYELRTYLINVKKGLHTLEEARELTKKYVSSVKKIASKYENTMTDTLIICKLRELSSALIRRRLTEILKDEGE